MFFIFTKGFYDKKRLIEILSVFISLLMILSVRIYILQVYPSEKVQNSYQNHQEEKITDMNYMIFDTNLKDLMKYNKKYVLVFDTKPFSLNNYEETLEDLMALNFIMKSEDSNFSYSDIMKQSGKVYYYVCEDTYDKINKLKNIKGIYTYVLDSVDIKEAWSISSILSKALSDENTEQDSFEGEMYEYLKNNETPKEKFYLDEKAVYAKQSLYISDENRNLKLTIDKDIEDKIREVLDSDKYKYLDNVGVTLMESDSGKVRAVVQKDESRANINLGMQQLGYEPGSIYKTITLAAGLDMGLININDQYTCTGEICKSAHGKMSVERAFEKSCNDVFAQIGNKIGYENLMKYSKEQGLYSRVIGLKDENINEAEGVMPSEESGINNISIGQCMNVTPLQMIGAINTIVNDGVYIKPYIVESILDKDDNVVKEFESESKKIYSETTAKLVKKSMQQVINKGTGVKAKTDGIIAGGKTGSSTGNENKTHGWFAGYFTINKKTYTMIIFTPEIECAGGIDEEELGGGDTAAPIFKDVVNKLK